MHCSHVSVWEKVKVDIDKKQVTKKRTYKNYKFSKRVLKKYKTPPKSINYTFMLTKTNYVYTFKSIKNIFI